MREREGALLRRVRGKVKRHVSQERVLAWRNTYNKGGLAHIPRRGIGTQPKKYLLHFSTVHTTVIVGVVQLCKLVVQQRRSTKIEAECFQQVGTISYADLLSIYVMYCTVSFGMNFYADWDCLWRFVGCPGSYRPYSLDILP
jgi:hypothetical protein